MYPLPVLWNVSLDDGMAERHSFTAVDRTGASVLTRRVGEPVEAERRQKEDDADVQ